MENHPMLKRKKKWQETITMFKNCVHLPFDYGRFKVSLRGLNDYFGSDISKYYAKEVKTRVLGFSMEVLTVCLTIEGETEEDIYLRVTNDSLWVGCTKGTSSENLSLHAYLVIREMIGEKGHCDFHYYYWPDFFYKFGDSKYLNVINENDHLKISLKPEFSSFYRPFDNLAYPSYHQRHKRRLNIYFDRENFDELNNNGCGFSLDTISTLLKISFLWENMGKYFQLSYRSKIDEQIFAPSKNNVTYFANSKNEPYKFHLFDSITDCLTTTFFANRGFKILVLKEHYDQHFKGFLEELERFYEIITVSVSAPKHSPYEK